MNSKSSITLDESITQINLKELNDIINNKSEEFKILVWGDPHAKINNLTQFVPFVKGSIKLAKKINPNINVVLGDTMNDHDVIKGYAYNEAINFLKELKEIAPTYVLIGNHDMYNQTDFMTEDHCFIALKEWENLEIIDKTQTDTFREYKFTFVPFVPNGRFREALDYSDNWEGSDLIFAHQDFEGHSLSTFTDGDPWEEKETIISGHIHSYENLPNNIIYIGTPYQQNYTDISDNSVSLFTFKDGEMTHERYKIPGIKTRKKITIEAYDLEDFKIPKDMILKVIIEGTREEINMAKNTRTYGKLCKLKGEGFSVTFNVTNHISLENSNKSVSNKSFKNDLLGLLTKREMRMWKKIFKEYKI